MDASATHCVSPAEEDLDTSVVEAAVLLELLVSLPAVGGGEELLALVKAVATA